MSVIDLCFSLKGGNSVYNYKINVYDTNFKPIKLLFKKLLPLKITGILISIIEFIFSGI